MYFIISTLALISCEEEKESPGLRQVSVYEITNYTANILRSVINDRNLTIKTIGICLSVNEAPTTKNAIYRLEDYQNQKVTNYLFGVLSNNARQSRRYPIVLTCTPYLNSKLYASKILQRN